MNIIIKVWNNKEIFKYKLGGKNIYCGIYCKVKFVFTLNLLIRLCGFFDYVGLRLLIVF